MNQPPQRVPPRYVPTLTEVVAPLAFPSAAPSANPPARNPVDLPALGSQPEGLDREEWAQTIVHQIRPQLEAELRSMALELFEAQFSALLPALQLHIEEAVREAMDRTLPDRNSLR